MPVKEIKDAAEAAGISWRTVERVKNGLRDRILVRQTRKDEQDRLGKGWVWQLLS